MTSGLVDCFWLLSTGEPKGGRVEVLEVEGVCFGRLLVLFDRTEEEVDLTLTSDAVAISINWFEGLFVCWYG